MEIRWTSILGPSIEHKFRFVNDHQLLINIFLIILLVIAVPSFALLYKMPSKDVIYLLSLLMLIITIWICSTIKKISPDVFNFYSLFMLSAMLFNGGQIYLEVFHLNKEGILEDKFDPYTLSLTLYLVIISLTSFHIGGLLSIRSKKNNSKNTVSQDLSSGVTAQSLRIIGYGLLALSIVPTLIMAITALKIVLSGGYFALYQQNHSAGLASSTEGVISILSRFIIPALFFLYAGSKKKPITRICVSAGLFVYICIFFFLGWRGYGTMLLFAGLWARHMLVKPLPLRNIFIGGIFLLFVLFPTIKHIRNIEGSSRLSLQSYINIYFTIENPAIYTISEMGGSMQTIAYTMQLIPDSRPFAFGSTYIYVASSVIPNLFWDLHPAVKYGSLSRWLTKTVDPFFFHRGGGLGYSFIAEAYANFGWIGTPIVIGLIGFFLARLAAWPTGSEDYAGIAVVSVCMATLLFWVRGDANFVFRPLVFYAFVPYTAFRFNRNLLDRMLGIKRSK